MTLPRLENSRHGVLGARGCLTYAAIETVVPVHDRETNIADNAMDRLVLQDDCHLLPGVEVGVGL